jgi:outer membrane protein assembly factor BamB
MSVSKEIFRPARAGLARACAGLAGAVLLTACSSESEKLSRPAALPAITATVQARPLWQLDVGGAAGSFLRPCALENAIYAASRGGRLVRVDPSTGKEVWRVEVAGGIAGGVGSDGLSVAVAGPRGNVAVYDAEGKHRWDAQVSSDVIVPPLVGHGLVLVRSSDNRVTAFDLSSGARRWVFQKQPPPLTLHGETEMVFSGDNVLIGFPSGRLAAIALSNGAGRWDAGVSEPKGATEVERLADVLGVPGMIEGEVCAASYQGRIGCFDARSGDLQWAREFSAGAGVAVSTASVFGVDASSRVNAFQRSSGAGLWQNSALLNRRLGAPVAMGKLVAVGDFEGHIHFLDADDGKIVGRFDTGSGPIISTPQLWNGAALFQTASGRLIMLGISASVLAF